MEEHGSSLPEAVEEYDKWNYFIVRSSNPYEDFIKHYYYENEYDPKRFFTIFGLDVICYLNYEAVYKQMYDVSDVEIDGDTVFIY